MNEITRDDTILLVNFCRERSDSQDEVLSFLRFCKEKKISLIKYNGNGPIPHMVGESSTLSIGEFLTLMKEYLDKDMPESINDLKSRINKFEARED